MSGLSIVALPRGRQPEAQRLSAPHPWIWAEDDRNQGETTEQVFKRSVPDLITSVPSGALSDEALASLRVVRR